MAEETLPPRGSIEAKDPFSMAPPGYGLTSDNERWPWGKPQEQVNPEEVLRRAVESLKVPHVREEMLKLLLIGASVEALVEGYVFQAFQEGGFSPDVGLLIKGPLGIFIANMAEEANIPYRLFENDNELDKDEMDDETFVRMMKDNNPQMFEYVRENLNAALRAGNRPMESNFMNMKRGED